MRFWKIKILRKKTFFFQIFSKKSKISNFFSFFSHVFLFIKRKLLFNYEDGQSIKSVFKCPIFSHFLVSMKTFYSQVLEAKNGYWLEKINLKKIKKFHFWAKINASFGNQNGFIFTFFDSPKSLDNFSYPHHIPKI